MLNTYTNSFDFRRRIYFVSTYLIFLKNYSSSEEPMFTENFEFKINIEHDIRVSYDVERLSISVKHKRKLLFATIMKFSLQLI